jgi:L-ribulose-5-phosphate 4-epimerase
LSALAVAVKRDVGHVAATLRATGTQAPSSVGFVAQRVQGEDKLVVATYPDPWDSYREAKVGVVGYDGTSHIGAAQFRTTGKQFARLFQERQEINTLIHIHPVHLAAWAGTHRAFPIRYVAAQRNTLAREIPVYIDRRPGEVAFILEQLAREPHLPAILEANGGATFWGDGIVKIGQFILLLEEAARLQILAETIGGAQEYGPGVLELQWRRTGLIPAAAE